jgi:D-glycero-D-manno-heptose 1,7-bisphosphate phosphatase
LTQAVYLVGGLGTRLKERTGNVPKPLLNIAGRPFIEYLLDEASRHGFTDILLLAGYLSHQVVEHYHGRDWRGARITVLCEPEPMGTGGALRFALPHLSQRFLLANGDSFFDINLRALASPLPKGGMVMALRSLATDTRYGRVRMNGEQVVSFHASMEGGDGPINGGVYCLDRRIVEQIPGGRISLESEVFPEIARAGRICGRLFDEYFIDIGVLEDFARAQVELPMRVRRPAVFFDRDGVLNADTGYVHRKQDFVWLPGATEAIRFCNDHGVFVFVVTNQAGVAHGLYDERAIDKLHGWIGEELAVIGAHIDAFIHCPHHPEGKRAPYRAACRCRKPAPGMILDLLSRWSVDPTRSILVGDKQSDLDAGSAAGIESHLHESGNLCDFVKRCLGGKGI